MTSTHHQGIVLTLLQQLHGHGYLRPEAGPLKARLIKAVLDSLEGDQGRQLSEEHDAEVSIGRQEGEEDVTVGVRLEHAGRILTADLPLASLSDAALEDLAGYLTRLTQRAPAAASVETDKVAVRKNTLTDIHEQGTASARLKVSPQWLKSVIPCTDYSYDEIEGKKYIRDYYWSKELIERLFKIKCSKTTPEDLQYVAKECCEGDQEWARDLIARLKSPNRAEAAVKDPAQKSPAKGQTKPAVPGGERSERSRSRSRHRKPFRDAGKDQGRKPDPASGPKPPAN